MYSPRYSGKKNCEGDCLHSRPRCPTYKTDTYDGRSRRTEPGRISRIFSEAANGGVKKWSLLTSGVLEVSSNYAKFRFEKVKQAVYALFLTNERDNRLLETAGIWTGPCQLRGNLKKRWFVI
jgi:hypothetical protein